MTAFKEALLSAYPVGSEISGLKLVSVSLMFSTGLSGGYAHDDPIEFLGDS